MILILISVVVGDPLFCKAANPLYPSRPKSIFTLSQTCHFCGPFEGSDISPDSRTLLLRGGLVLTSWFGRVRYDDYSISIAVATSTPPAGNFVRYKTSIVESRSNQ